MNKRLVSSTKPPRQAPQSMASPRRHGKSASTNKSAGWRLPGLSWAAMRRGISLLLPFVVLLSLALLLIWERVTVNELAASIAALEAQRNQLADQNGKLRVQLEQLAGFGRISKLASQNLGLVTVPHQVIVVEDK